MKRRNLISAFMALPLLSLGVPASAAGLSLAQIESYLNAFRTAKGSFVQVNPNGTLSQGQFLLSKPGKIRFDYANPNPALVVSDGVSVGVFDKKSKRGSQRYYLNQTPLKILLADKVNLSAGGMVKSVKTEGPETKVTAIDPQNPGQGSITMVFTANPVQLRKWTIREKSGKETTVVLNDLQSNVGVSQSSFSLNRAEKDFGKKQTNR